MAAPDHRETVDILLATYNGEAFLDQQLASIFNQTYPHWRLIVRDDGSTDATLDIIRSYQERYPGKITLLADEDGNLGPTQNFSRMLENSAAHYVAFCDQDDVWLPEKLATTLDKMRLLELQHGATAPLLVYTDLRVVDEGLHVIYDSFWKYQRLDPKTGNSLNRLLVQNVVTGCTAMFNKPLKEIALPIPAEARVHDWWIALVASAFGCTGYVEHPTVLYRKHGDNVIGARSFLFTHLLVNVRDFFADYRVKKSQLLSLFDQADVLAKRYFDSLETRQISMIHDFLKIPTANIILRSYYGVKCRCLPNDLARSIRFVLFSSAYRWKTAA